MHDHPDEFLGIQLHVGDSYEVSWSRKRWNFYNLTYTPTSVFDGVVEEVGATTPDSAQYAVYWGIISSRLLVPTDTTIELSVVRVALDTFDVTATISIEPAGTGKDLRAHIPLCLDNYPSSADGRYRNCVMDNMGSDNFTLAAGASYVFTKQFQLTGDSWTNKEDTKFVGFVRDQGASGPAEVHNSTQLAWPFYIDGDVDRDGDVDIQDLAGLLGTYGYCDGAPEYVPEADFNWDLCITITDLASLLGNYGYTP